MYTSSQIVRVTAASGLVQEFRIVLPTKVKIKNITSLIYSRLYGTSLFYCKPLKKLLFGLQKEEECVYIRDVDENLPVFLGKINIKL